VSNSPKAGIQLKSELMAKGDTIDFRYALSPL